MAWFQKKQNNMENIAPEGQEQPDGELVAVLAAAVAFVLGSAPGNIVIRSYKKSNPAWRRSGREMQQRF